ncbi:MAG: hypothetical protein BJ554DRAFT_7571 [Olpidium bornovanus]|uniref:MIT domain-containing protein n=1 Tax=Olpidium bornovanus TaxID=278681 RepID=A0A8H8DJ56_9FUNG|nr:MAG: hypothetical protein BJ554DRAFT_7571 [Olpidium bornovanus]
MMASADAAAQSVADRLGQHQAVAETGDLSRPIADAAAPLPFGSAWGDDDSERRSGAGGGGGGTPCLSSSWSSPSGSSTPSSSSSGGAAAFAPPAAPRPVERSRRDFIREATARVSAAARAAVLGGLGGGSAAAAALWAEPSAAVLEERPPAQPQVRTRRRSRIAYLRTIRRPRRGEQSPGERVRAAAAAAAAEAPDRDFVVPVNNLMDAPSVETAADLALVAAALERRGRRAEATEAYLQAVDKLLQAFPVSADVDRKEALEQKLRGYMRAAKMSSAAEMDGRGQREPESGDPGADQLAKRQTGGAADTVINFAVRAAVCVKQSPIPDLVGAVARCTVRKARKVDEFLGVQEKAWRVGRMAVNKSIELDREYELHHKFADLAFVAAAAALKAGIASREAKPYRELRAACEEYHARITVAADRSCVGDGSPL